MKPGEMDRVLRKQKGAAAAAGVLPVFFCLLFLTLLDSRLHAPDAGWEILAGGLLLLYAGPMLLGTGICVCFLRKLYQPPVRGVSGGKRAVCFLAVFPFACLAGAAAFVGALTGLILRSGSTFQSDEVRKREKEQFIRSRLGYMTGAGQNAEKLGLWKSSETGISLFGGLLASLGCLMLCCCSLEGKGPGKAFDRSLEIYVRLKKWFDALVVPGRMAALLPPFLYGFFLLLDRNGAALYGEGKTSAMTEGFFFWLDRVGEVLLPAALLIHGGVQFLILFPAVYFPLRHFLRCFLLFSWNAAWEEKYREKLQRDGIAPNIETVDLPGM